MHMITKTAREPGLSVFDAEKLHWKVCTVSSLTTHVQHLKCQIKRALMANMTWPERPGTKVYLWPE